MKVQFNTTSFALGKGTTVIVPVLGGYRCPCVWDLAIAELPFCALKDFKAKAGEVYVYYENGERILFVGLGPEEELTWEQLRRCYAKAVLKAMALKVEALSVIPPAALPLDADEVLKWAFKGALEANYSYLQNKSDLQGEAIPVKQIAFFEVPEGCKAKLQEQVTLIQCVHYARDLGNLNAYQCTPSYLAEEAKRLAKEGKCKVTIQCRDECLRQGLELFCAVGAGSEESCASKLIIVEYEGNPGSKEKVCFVGKGVTYDTGGYSIKPTAGMMTMRGDMCGAAAVLALLKAVIALRPKVNAVFVVPSTENVIAAKSFKLGDVYKGYSGKTVEINNTDAEGRLILADAIAYAEKNYAPSVIVDIATLTGAAIIALGYEYGAILSRDEELIEKAKAASSLSGEPVWHLPASDDYASYLKSSVADMCNAGARAAGTITAYQFICNHIQKTRFLHIDMAAVDNTPHPKTYHGHSTFTGYGPILLWEILQSLYE